LNTLLARIEQTVDRERSFLAHASHELRTPLALLRTELELALRRPREAAELREAIESVASEVDRLERLVDDLLLLAQSGEGSLEVRPETMAASDLLGAVAARFAPALEEDGRRLDVQPSDLPLRGDRRLLHRAVTNLVANAWEHGAGTVRLGVRPRGSEVEVVVGDSGAGIDPQLRSRLTQRFVRGPGSSGAGLGVAIVAAIAQAHGGSCGVRRENGSTEAWISLPATPTKDDATEHDTTNGAVTTAGATRERQESGHAG
jgi:signal transduction histidine kinase